MRRSTERGDYDAYDEDISAAAGGERDAAGSPPLLRAEAAQAAGVDAHFWWRREGDADAGFRYIGLNGQELRSESTLARIERIVIPPAWTQVRISPELERKIQAWGYDQAGRRQYRYSEAHERARDLKKWRRVLHVARSLPELRAVTNAHLQRDLLDRDKVMATVVRLMCRAYFRAGSERYAVRNRTFGICTLDKAHVEVCGNSLVFTYRGKRRKDQRQVVAATPLVEIVEQLLELPGQRLFQYVPAHRSGATRGGARRRTRPKPVTAPGVNEYLKDVLGEKLTSKDLRTFGGTVRAATILSDLGPAADEREAKRNVALACKLVAAELGNTPAICRKAYIHPAVLTEYEAAGRTVDVPAPGRPRSGPVPAHETEGFYPEEIALMRFLEEIG